MSPIWLIDLRDRFVLAVVVLLAASSLTACESQSPLPATLPTPMPGTGNVTGILVTGNPSGKPYRGGELYLAILLPADKPDIPPLVSFGTDVSIKAVEHNEESGTFTFINVKPGSYVIVIDQIITTILIPNPSGGGLLTVKVEADQTVRLGAVVVP